MPLEKAMNYAQCAGFTEHLVALFEAKDAEIAEQRKYRETADELNGVMLRKCLAKDEEIAELRKQVDSANRGYEIERIDREWWRNECQGLREQLAAAKADRDQALRLVEFAEKGMNDLLAHVQSAPVMHLYYDETGDLRTWREVGTIWLQPGWTERIVHLVPVEQSTTEDSSDTEKERDAMESFIKNQQDLPVAYGRTVSRKFKELLSTDEEKEREGES
jgi:hypothetical protein